ncbi:MAG: DUF3152 domain-containing protein [Kineosporiaceae bacterium]
MNGGRGPGIGPDDDPFPVMRRSPSPRREAGRGAAPSSSRPPRVARVAGTGPRRPSARVRRRRALVGALLVVLLGWAGVTGVRALTRDDEPSTPSAATVVSPAASSTPSAPATPSASSSDTPSPSPSDSPSPSSSPAAGADGSLTDADRAAGLLDRTIPQKGTGRLVTVPGSSPAPGKGRTVKVRVRVEEGLHVDGPAFAAYAMATLNDRRSWTHDGYTFARTDSSSADVTLVLASPRTSASLCLPLQTMGTLSCHSGPNTVLTLYRWVLATPDYKGDLVGYRHYVVNHEVGHALGHAHEYCSGPGKVAPVMMQQTKGLKGCRPNPWPYP